MIECIRITASVKHTRSSKLTTSKQDAKGKQTAAHTQLNIDNLFGW